MTLVFALLERRFSIILLPFIFVCQLNVYCQTDDKITTFKHSEFSFQYPAAWRVDTSHLMGTTVVALSPLSNSDDKFHENFNVLIQDAKPCNNDLENYGKISEKQILKLMNNATIYSSSIVKENNKVFYKLEYAAQQGMFNLRFVSYCFMKSDKAYLLTFTSEQGTFSSFKEIGEQILNSFTLFSK